MERLDSYEKLGELDNFCKMNPDQTSSPVSAPVQDTTSTTPLASLPKMPSPSEELPAPTYRGSLGAVFGIVVILIMVIIGALYFWGAKLTQVPEVQHGMTDGTVMTGTESSMTDTAR